MKYLENTLANFINLVLLSLNQNRHDDYVETILIIKKLVLLGGNQWPGYVVIIWIVLFG